LTSLDAEKLHTRYLPGIDPETLTLPRRYTLTHSDTTGDLFLTIGPDYDYLQISGLYTRLMRDEVLAEWKQVRDVFSIQVYCHVSGGLVFGGADWRRSIFRSEIPLVLEAIRYGDRKMFAKDETLDHVQILVHLQTSKSTKDQVEACRILCTQISIVAHLCGRLYERTHQWGSSVRRRTGP
jgi:hypothetical protein